MLTSSALTLSSKIAATWEEADWWKKVTAQMTDFLRSKVNWIGAAWISPDENKEEPKHEVWMLDYACGSGMLTRVTTGLACFMTNFADLPVRASPLGSLIPWASMYPPP